MTYLVNDNCIKCKHMDCVDVCPVDCFYEGENMLVINPTECIDCGVCEPECPVDAIIPDNVEGADKWLYINEEYSAKWPNITEKRPDDVPSDAEEYALEPNKFERFFSEKPGGSKNETSKT
jgi:ferredoxin